MEEFLEKLEKSECCNNKALNKLWRCGEKKNKTSWDELQYRIICEWELLVGEEEFGFCF